MVLHAKMNRYQRIVSCHSGLFLIAIAILILHGSLYPYDFHFRAGSPIAALTSNWAALPNGRGDLLANILLYVPLGASIALAINRPVPVWVAGLGGCLFSSGMEVLQFYDQGRVTSASDIYLNTLGTCVGAVTGGVIRRHAAFFQTGRIEAIPCVLLVAMLGYRLFPYVPTIDLHKYWTSLKPIFFQPVLNPQDGFRYFAIWLTASFLVARATHLRNPWAVTVLLPATVLAAKVLIVGQSISPSELLGCSIAIAVWLLFLEQRQWAAYVVAGVLFASMIAERLEPLDFRVKGAAFGWVPFRSFLSGSLEVGVQSFFEKVFLYGSLIWISSTAGPPIWKITIAVAALLFVTSIVETHLPGRSAEVTDAIMALSLGAVLGGIEASWSRSAPQYTPTEKKGEGNSRHTQKLP